MSPYYLIRPNHYYMIVDVRNYLYWIGTSKDIQIWYPVGWKY